MLLVRPQAVRSFLPNMMPGTPAYPAPTVLKPAPDRWTWYQHDTLPKAMWGSLASMGSPESESTPPITQLLLPSPSSGSLTTSPTLSPPDLPGG